MILNFFFLIFDLAFFFESSDLTKFQHYSGVLVLLDGNKHTAYGQEDATGLRLQLDGRTFVLENEHDPSLLRTATPGKLARLLVEQDAHVVPGTPYAEIEVMKMFLPLIAHAAGTVNFVKVRNNFQRFFFFF